MVTDRWSRGGVAQSGINGQDGGPLGPTWDRSYAEVSVAYASSELLSAAAEWRSRSMAAGRRVRVMVGRSMIVCAGGCRAVVS